MSSDVCLGILNDIAPVFRPYILSVCQDLELGLCKTRVDIERISGSTSTEGADSQFRIVLPYCSKKLKWDVIFDITTPWFAPDFRFDDDGFLNNIDEEHMEFKLPSLSKWNENNPKALCDVITELVTLYKMHQIKKLNEDESSRAYFEYSALLGDAVTSDNDIEVWVGGHMVEFLIKLNIDTSHLPELYNEGNISLIYDALIEEMFGVGIVPFFWNHGSSKVHGTNSVMETIYTAVDVPRIASITMSPITHSGYLGIWTEQNPGIDTALLFVRYPNSTNAELILSPLLTKSLGNINLPVMHQSGVLMDYVPMVTELLNTKIQDVIKNEKFKRELLAQLIVKYEGAVLEHDSNNAAFLFEMNDFHWILQVDIGIKFPERPPVLTLRSVYHNIKGKPKFKILQACPYKNFEGYIEQQVEIFKNECKGIIPTNQLVPIEN